MHGTTRERCRRNLASRTGLRSRTRNRNRSRAIGSAGHRSKQDRGALLGLAAGLVVGGELSRGNRCALVAELEVLGLVGEQSLAWSPAAFGRGGDLEPRPSERRESVRVYGSWARSKAIA